jgi:hypothetical protein
MVSAKLAFLVASSRQPARQTLPDQTDPLVILENIAAHAHHLTKLKNSPTLNQTHFQSYK